VHKFLVVFEKEQDTWGAYSPDLPGCVATGQTRDEVETLMFEAIQLHLDGLLEDGEPIPTSVAFAEMLALPIKAKAIG
jgi:predicted RNase H-like HicB family nuclease